MFGIKRRTGVKYEGPAILAVAPYLAAAGAAVSLIGGIKQLTAKAPKAPNSIADISKPTVAPTEDSALVADAKRRSLIAQQQRGGRSSTILTNDDNGTFGET